jgi:hypothetical protein
MRLVAGIVCAMLLGGCAVTDPMIGGVGSIHKSTFTLEPKKDADAAEDRMAFLQVVRETAQADGFYPVESPEKVINYESPAPWPCILGVRETDGRLVAEVWQYYEKRGPTDRFTKVEEDCHSRLLARFPGRSIAMTSERELRYPWESDTIATD